MKRYKNESTRLQSWDYGWQAAYFVTLVTKNRVHYFGEVHSGKMQLSAIGDIVASEWTKGADLRPDMNITLGAWQVMPDHFHAILEIGKNSYNSDHSRNKTTALPQEDMNTIAPPKEKAAKNSFGPQAKNLASIIRGFKGAVTRAARKINPDFAWQSRYHDRIIRDPKAYDTITQYIIDNPKNWGKSKDL